MNLSAEPNIFPDDPTQDSGPGIQAAIDKAFSLAGAGAPATVVFETDRTYYVSSITARNGAGIGPEVFFIDDEFGLRLEGNGSRLVRTMMAGPAAIGAHLFFIRDSDDIVIEDLVIDCDPLPYVDCIVRAVHGDGFDAEWVRGITDPALLLQFPPAKRWGWQLDPSSPGSPGIPGIMKRGAEIAIRASSISLGAPAYPSGADKWEFRGQNSHLVEVDDRISYQIRQGQSFYFVRTDDVILTNVRCYGASGMFVNAHTCVGVQITDCAIQTKAGRWRSINADGVHAEAVQDLHISNCTFQGQADDGLHLKDCHGFTVTDNSFVGLRGYAFTLDGDSKPASTNGVVTGNSAFYCSGSFVRHYAGAYTLDPAGTIFITGNRYGASNLIEHGNRTNLVRLISTEDPSLAIGIQFDAATTRPLENAPLVLVPKDSEAALWDLSHCVGNLGCCSTCSEHDVLTSAFARRRGAWLSIGAEDSGGPLNGSMTALQYPSPETPPSDIHVDDEFRVFVEPGDTPGTVSIRADLGGLTPTADPTGLYGPEGPRRLINRNPNIPSGQGSPAAVGDQLSYRNHWIGSGFAARQEWTLEILDGIE
ncbi:MAG: right-handed parallel beta-helix repeat-containing protein [Planctomycetota bacterium]